MFELCNKCQGSIKNGYFYFCEECGLTLHTRCCDDHIEHDGLVSMKKRDTLIKEINHSMFGAGKSQEGWIIIPKNEFLENKKMCTHFINDLNKHLPVFLHSNELLCSKCHESRNNEEFLIFVLTNNNIDVRNLYFSSYKLTNVILEEFESHNLKCGTNNKIQLKLINKKNFPIKNIELEAISLSGTINEKSALWEIFEENIAKIFLYDKIQIDLIESEEEKIFEMDLYIPKDKEIHEGKISNIIFENNLPTPKEFLNKFIAVNNPLIIYFTIRFTSITGFEYYKYITKIKFSII
ncbi:hypothetical protein [Methanobrevibacter sp. DSM 116169]|uniref:hypothetical protein n=1 Tax=Methanobrevibacter sp. DSM 116169 TaxID=3242727 RepID=UPI0038FCC984